MKRRVYTRKRRAVGGMWTFKRPSFTTFKRPAFTKAEYWKTKPGYFKNNRSRFGKFFTRDKTKAEAEWNKNPIQSMENVDRNSAKLADQVAHARGATANLAVESAAIAEETAKKDAAYAEQLLRADQKLKQTIHNIKNKRRLEREQSITKEAELETSEELNKEYAKVRAEEAAEIAALNPGSYAAASAALQARNSVKKAEELKQTAEKAILEAKTAAISADDAAKTMGAVGRLAHEYKQGSWAGMAWNIIEAAKTSVIDPAVDLHTLAREANSKIELLESELAAAEKELRDAEEKHEAALKQKTAQIDSTRLQTIQIQQNYKEPLKQIEGSRDERLKMVVRNKTRNYHASEMGKLRRSRKNSTVPVNVAQVPVYDYPAAPSPTITVQPGLNLLSFLSKQFDTSDAIHRHMEENMPLLAHDNYSSFVNIICGINKYPFIKSYVFPNYADTIQKIANEIINLVETDDKLARYMKKIVERIKPNKTQFGGVEYLNDVVTNNRNEWGTDILWPENLRRFIHRMNEV